MSGQMQPQSRAHRALTVLAAHPEGLPTPQIAKILGEYPWGTNEIARELRKQEARSRVTANRRHQGAAVWWKITEQGAKVAEWLGGKP